MRDLLFKNLTSNEKKRKIISTSEIVDKQGIRSIIHRHFVCAIKEVAGKKMEKPLPYLYVLKNHNTRESKEKFFCKIKGSIFAIYNAKLYQINYMHSLKITLAATPSNLVKYSEGEIA